MAARRPAIARFRTTKTDCMVRPPHATHPHPIPPSRRSVVSVFWNGQRAYPIAQSSRIHRASGRSLSSPVVFNPLRVASSIPRSQAVKVEGSQAGRSEMDTFQLVHSQVTTGRCLSMGRDYRRTMTGTLTRMIIEYSNSWMRPYSMRECMKRKCVVSNNIMQTVTDCWMRLGRQPGRSQTSVPLLTS